MQWLKRYLYRIPNKLSASILGLLLIAFLIVSLYFVFNITLFDGIENILRYSIISIAIIISLLIILYCLNTIILNRFWHYFCFVLTILLLISGQSFVIFNLNKLFSSVASLNKEYITYSTSLITLKDSPINNIADLKNLKIGIIDEKDNIEGYVISQELIKEHKLAVNNDFIEYDDFLHMINDLYDNKIAAIFLSTNYAIMFSHIEHFNNIEIETKIIASKEKKMTKQGTIAKGEAKKLTEPFTLLLLGVDSHYESLDKSAAFNGDSLLLITFNPTTLNATIMSIPRDTYVPIMCFKGKIENKITHAAWYGESCMIKTIENFTGIDIDYYIKINFKGLVKLVDALEGIEVDVPYSLCEQDSSRRWGEHMIYVEKGLQMLNGEQALALSRNREPHKGMCAAKWTQSERSAKIREKNQQLIIKAIMNKAKEIKNLNQIYKILDAINKNIDTNLTTNQLLDFYNVGKNIIAKTQTYLGGDIVTTQSLTLKVYGKTIWDEGMGLPLYNDIYYRASLKEVVTAMKINLGLEKPTLATSFSFSVDNLYTPQAIGNGSYKVDYVINTVPNFTDSNKAFAENWGEQHNIPLNFITITKDDPDYLETYTDGQIIHQSIPTHYRVSNLNKTTGITLKIISKPKTPTIINCMLEENYDHPSCLIPNFVEDNWTIDRFNNWKATVPGSFIISALKVESTKPTYDITKAGLIFDQNQEPGTKIIDIVELIVQYYEPIKEEANETEIEPSIEEDPTEKD